MYQAELHRHLDLSTRMSTLFELCVDQEITPKNTSFSDFKESVAIGSPLADLSTVIDRFEIYQRVLKSPDILRRIARETVEDCYNEGSRLVELRYSPSFVTTSNSLSWNDVHQAFLAGIEDAQNTRKDMKSGLICIITREFDQKLIEQTANFYLENLNTFAGIDLAGKEDVNPAKKFESVFSEIRKATPDKITIHAGEGSGAGNIWDAIELLGASRIGHGIDCIQDPELMLYLKSNKICLEVCPTSNYLTQATKTLKEHPLPKIYHAGIPVTINTDDPSIFDTTLSNEIDVCMNILGMKESEIAQCFEFAKKHSFLN